MTRRLIFIGLGFSLFLSGCSPKNSGCSVFEEQRTPQNTTQQEIKPYSYGVTPVIGSRHDDARAVMDMGVVLKIFVADYVDRYGSLVAAHDRYLVVKKPTFVVGVQEPKDMPIVRGLINSAGNIPFVFRDAELDKTPTATDDALKKSVNLAYKDQEGNAKARMKPDDKDQKIKEFLKNNK